MKNSFLNTSIQYGQSHEIYIKDKVFKIGAYTNGVDSHYLSGVGNIIAELGILIKSDDDVHLDCNCLCINQNITNRDLILSTFTYWINLFILEANKINFKEKSYSFSFGDRMGIMSKDRITVGCQSIEGAQLQHLIDIFKKTYLL